MRANDLQLIRLDDDRVVLKRGVTEVLVGGAGIEATVGKLVALLGEGMDADQVLEAFPEEGREDVLRLVKVMRDRRLLDEPGPPAASNGHRLEACFYDCFGLTHEVARKSLETASVAVYGTNLISQSLVANLVAAGVGTVTLGARRDLDDEFVDRRWLDGIHAGPGDVRVVEGGVDDATIGASTIVCATSDLGEAPSFEDLNRLALAAGKLFLPSWVSSLVGYVGPLVHPFDTACYRCYRLRADANDPRHTVSAAIRRHETGDPAARPSPGLLPPMARIVGEIASMEVLKVLTQVAPSDVAGRLIEMNLVSFESVVHRVLKVPRCPDCSDVMRRAGVVTATGPQIPFHE